MGSRVRKFYTCKTELYRAKRIATDFTKETKIIESKYENAHYPKRFIRSIINEFNSKEAETEDVMIPEWLFDERTFLPIKVPYCEKNESYTKRFIQKLNEITNEKFKPMVIWQTRKI